MGMPTPARWHVAALALLLVAGGCTTGLKAPSAATPTAAVSPAPGTAASTPTPVVAPALTASPSSPPNAIGPAIARLSAAAGWSEVALTEQGVSQAAATLRKSNPTLATTLETIVASSRVTDLTYLAVGYDHGRGVGTVQVREGPSGSLALAAVEEMLVGGFKQAGLAVTSSRVSLPLAPAVDISAKQAATSATPAPVVRTVAAIKDDILYVVAFTCTDGADGRCLRDADAMIPTLALVSTAGSASLPAGWKRVTSKNIGYSIALPGWSTFNESVAGGAGQGPYDLWMVRTSPSDLAFGLMIGYYPPGGGTPESLESPEVITIGGVDFEVGVPPNPFGDQIDLTAKATMDGHLWLLTAEAAGIATDRAKQSLFKQILRTFTR